MLDVEVKGEIGDFHVDATFHAGQGVTGIFGKSGAGKTTILRAIAGLWCPGSGHVSLQDKQLMADGHQLVPVHKRAIGAVFQSPLLFPNMNVRENLVYSKPATMDHFDEVVTLLDLGPLLDRMPSNLSGGEAQRVAIGRALISRPRLLLFDEPATGLDGARRDELFPYIQALCAETALPILYVSQNADEIALLSRRVLMVDRGRVIEDLSNAAFKKRMAQT